MAADEKDAKLKEHFQKTGHSLSETRGKESEGTASKCRT
jgi:hypothetical protein